MPEQSHPSQSDREWEPAPTLMPAGVRWFAWRDLGGNDEQVDGDLYLTQAEAQARCDRLNGLLLRDDLSKL